MDLRFDTVPSPLGPLTLVASAQAACALDFADGDPHLRAWLKKRFGSVSLRRARDPHGYSTRLRAYFAGDLDALEEIAVDTGGTAFQRGVWIRLRGIAAGTTVSYGDIARALGHPTAARAVGAAAGRNPIALVIPCHRVVGADGSLTGYAGGLSRKRWLLAHEGIRR